MLETRSPRSRATDLRRLARLAGATTGLILLAIFGVVASVWWTLPPSRQTLRVAGLAHPVAITLDGTGIPRIRAGSAEDAAAALGFLHARDRMFQMELMRRVGSGRVAEIAGPAALPIDRMMRVLGLRRRAAAAYPILPPGVRAQLDAYSRGVNAEIAARGRFIAPEFLLSGAPEPWTPVDSLLWGRLMALTLAGNWRTELARLALSDRVPLPRQLALQPEQADVPPPQASLRPDADPELVRLASDLDHLLPRYPAAYTLPGEASDEWAVDGAHSATGAPLLAGDPHLALGFPGLWYLARIDRPGGVLTGATAPGVPFLVLGQNTHIAWTFTSNEADTQDLFIEHPGPGGYATPGGPRPFVARTERIRVRGAPDTVITVRETRHGPVISDALPDRHGRVLAVQMEALAPTTPEHDDIAAGLAALDDATTVAQAGRAAAASAAPVQNLLVADRNRIALFTTGMVPVRRAGDGSFPQDGADGAHDWTGAASGDALPHVVSPASGHLLNGNERTAGPDFPVYMGRDWTGDWRARRMRELLEGRPQHDVDDFVRMQVDTTSAFAGAVLPGLLARPLHPASGSRSAVSLALLSGWDGRMTGDAPQPLIFNAWMQRFVADRLQALDIDQAIVGPWTDFAAFLLGPRSGDACIDCNQALLLALDEATAGLASTHGRDPRAWRWSGPHVAVFDNAFLSALPLVRTLARRSIAIPGDDTTLFRAGSGTLGDFGARHGAAYRGVYDLADPARSRYVATPGQSGNWISAQAWNLMHRWASGDSMMIPEKPVTISASATLLP